jgi:hypothetical protein
LLLDFAELVGKVRTTTKTTHVIARSCDLLNHRELAIAGQDNKKLLICPAP